MGKKTPALAVFELPEGLDDKLNVIPADLLQAMVNVLSDQPAKAVFNILVQFEQANQKGSIVGIADYLKSLNSA